MNKLLTVLALVFISYFIWHLGRWYEYRLVQTDIKAAYADSYDAFFFDDPLMVDTGVVLGENELVTGSLATGRCFKESSEAYLSKYYPR